MIGTKDAASRVPRRGSAIRWAQNPHARRGADMEYRKLGQSDLVTSVIGFGGFPIGRGHYGPFDDDEAIRSVHRAIDLGVTLFDTAAGYGLGEGEKLLGRALEGRRDRIVLVSKGSTAPDRMAVDLERQPATAANRLSRPLPDSLAGCERSHRRFHGRPGQASSSRARSATAA